ncbi:Cell cycle checkpoint protein rad17 [Geranomyces variabilis]|nr:Cell cycle checkpoint protein rad17 [Geranomyces variabilis]
MTNAKRKGVLNGASSDIETDEELLTEPPRRSSPMKRQTRASTRGTSSGKAAGTDAAVGRCTIMDYFAGQGASAGAGNASVRGGVSDRRSSRPANKETSTPLASEEPPPAVDSITKVVSKAQTAATPPSKKRRAITAGPKSKRPQSSQCAQLEDDVATSPAEGPTKRRKTTLAMKPTGKSSAENQETEVFSGSQRQRWVIPNQPVEADALPPPESKLWIDSYRPSCEKEIAVHTRKVADVRTWLSAALKDSARRNRPRHSQPKVLVLSGPSGAGKTALIQMLANELRYDILEWNNPINSNAMNVSNENHGDSYFSLIRAFQDFLASASKTPALSFESSTNALAGSSSQQPVAQAEFSENERKVILIEDLPNISNLTTRNAIHSAIRTYVRSPRTRYPVVFIVTDAVTSDPTADRRDTDRDIITIRTLIPSDLLTANLVKQISFNPIAPTYLTKALVRVADAQFRGRAGLRPDKAAIDAVVQSSEGDIRCAINALQFYALRKSQSSIAKETRRKTKRVAKSKTPGISVGLDYVGRRELNPDMFHSLGRILYSKRVGDDDPAASQPTAPVPPPTPLFPLPPFQAHCERRPLKHNAEDVFAAAHMDADSFNLFLHQNYTPFFAEIEEVTYASERMSLADTLSGNWLHRHALGQYAASITSRGLQFAHMYSIPNQRYRQLHRPQAFSVAKQARELTSATRDAAWDWLRSGVAVAAEARDGGGGQDGDACTLTTMPSEKALMQEILPFAAILSRLSQQTPAPTFRGGGQGKTARAPAPIFLDLAPHHRALLTSLTALRARTPHQRPIGEGDYAGVVTDDDCGVDDSAAGARGTAGGPQPPPPRPPPPLPPYVTGRAGPVLEDDIVG